MICPDCGKRREKPLRDALQLKTHECLACRNKRMVRPRYVVTCPGCGRKREYAPHNFMQLSAGVKTPCRSCSMKAGRAAFLVRQRIKKTAQERVIRARRAINELLIPLMQTDHRFVNVHVPRVDRRPFGSIYFTDRRGRQARLTIDVRDGIARKVLASRRACAVAAEAVLRQRWRAIRPPAHLQHAWRLALR